VAESDEVRGLRISCAHERPGRRIFSNGVGCGFPNSRLWSCPVIAGQSPDLLVAVWPRLVPPGRVDGPPLHSRRNRRTPVGRRRQPRRIRPRAKPPAWVSNQRQSRVTATMRSSAKGSAAASFQRPMISSTSAGLRASNTQPPALSRNVARNRDRHRTPPLPRSSARTLPLCTASPAARPCLTSSSNQRLAPPPGGSPALRTNGRNAAGRRAIRLFRPALWAGGTRATRPRDRIGDWHEAVGIP